MHTSKRATSCDTLAKQFTLPETNELHLKMDGWKSTFPFWIRPIFRDELLVLGRVKAHLNQTSPEMVSDLLIVMHQWCHGDTIR